MRVVLFRSFSISEKKGEKVARPSETVKSMKAGARMGLFRYFRPALLTKLPPPPTQADDQLSSMVQVSV